MSLLAALTAGIAVLTILGCLYLYRTNPDQLSRVKVVKLWVLALPELAVYRLIAIVVLALLPAAAVTTSNLEVVEGAKSVEACASCHVMQPMVTDMVDNTSTSLAARHFKSPAMAENQCFTCHSGYGWNGALEAKLDGYRHLVRYTTKTYEEPIEIRGHFDSSSCLSCHSGKGSFEVVRSHEILLEETPDPGEIRCVNCHGLAHPSRASRTPGSKDYDRLMRGGK